jgi:hypothetical protein
VRRTVEEKMSKWSSPGGLGCLTWLAMWLVIVPACAADNKAELQNLYSMMNVLNQEQQSVFQQFQMLQEMRRENDRAFSTGQLMAPSPDMQVQNYDDMVQRQKDIMRRGQELEQQAQRLYTQYSEIGAKKAQLQQRILELSVPQ